MWNLKRGKLPEFSHPILISGLPGIGNVGKIVVDYLSDQLKAKEIISFESDSMPNSVIIKEDNLVDLPSIKLYHKAIAGKSILILNGNYQPIDERSCYEFCELMLKEAKEWKVEQIITLGGIGLNELAQDPIIYITGNSKANIEGFMKKTDLNPNIYGIVGPIMGVSGVLVGLSRNHGMDAVSLLGETLAHPFYFGLKPARKMLKLLDAKYSLNLDFGKIDAEILEIDKLLGENVNISDVKSLQKFTKYSEMNYIG
jgi:hypothetical protein